MLDLVLHERFLERARDVMGAVQHGDVGQLRALFGEQFYLRGNPLGFIGGGGGVVVDYRAFSCANRD
jgi:hypothetical protein